MFFALQMDGSTDLKNNIFWPFISILMLKMGKCVCVCAKWLSVRQPSSRNAGGLYEGLMRGFNRGNVKDWEN